MPVIACGWEKYNFYSYFTSSRGLLIRCYKDNVCTEEQLEEFCMKSGWWLCRSLKEEKKEEIKSKVKSRSDIELFTERRETIWIVENILQHLPFPKAISLVFQSIDKCQEVLKDSLRTHMGNMNRTIVPIVHGGLGYDLIPPKENPVTKGWLKEFEEEMCTDEHWAELLKFDFPAYIISLDLDGLNPVYLTDLQASEDVKKVFQLVCAIDIEHFIDWLDYELLHDLVDFNLIVAFCELTRRVKQRWNQCQMCGMIN